MQIDALLRLSAVRDRINHDLVEVKLYNRLLDMYERRGDCDGALKLYAQMQTETRDARRTPTTYFANKLNGMASKAGKPAVFDKETMVGDWHSSVV